MNQFMGMVMGNQVPAQQVQQMFPPQVQQPQPQMITQ